MNSIATHITPKTLLAELRLHRQKHKGAFLLMEGSTDAKRFAKFIDRNAVRVVICWGKPNVLAVVDMSQNGGHKDVLGLVDADFDRLAGPVAHNDDLIHSAGHDFDLDVCRTDAFNRYLGEMALPDRLAAEGGSAAVLASLMDALRPLSALRYANAKHKLRYRLYNVELHGFFDGATVDRDAMVDAVSTGAFDTAAHKATLRAHVDNYAGTAFPTEQFTNGHDLMAALGVALRKRLANRLAPQTSRAEVERHMRLAFDHVDFGECGLAARITGWQAIEARPPVLRIAA